MPYRGTKPLTLTVNGHKLVIIAPEPELLEEFVERYGGDAVKGVQPQRYKSESAFVKSLERKSSAKVVMAPAGVELSEVLASLELSLPWLH